MKRQLDMPTARVDRQVDHLSLAKILKKIVDGNDFPADFYHAADPYSTPPADLVSGLAHDPSTGVDDEKGKVWYFYSTARRQKSAATTGTARQVSSDIPQKSSRRVRAIKGAVVGTSWHPEKAKMLILDENKYPIAYSYRLSYVRKAVGKRKREGLGWIMVEIVLAEQASADEQLVLCKLYRSTRAKGREASTKASVPCNIVPLPPAAPLPSSGDISPLGSKPEEPPIVKHKPDLLIDNNPNHLGSTGEGVLSRSGWVIINTKPAAAAVPTVVMKLGASSINSTERIKLMAKHVRSFTAGGAVGVRPAVVLSPMANTSTNLHVAALKALSHGPGKSSEIDELAVTRRLHLSTVAELGLDTSILSGLFHELGHTFSMLGLMERLNEKIRYYLAEFGERICTTIFAAYLNYLETDAGEEWKSQAVNIGGRGGSDLTATTIAKELGSTEIQFWEDVDGVMTCDPTVCGNAMPQPCLTFEEAAEIMIFGTQTMQLATEGGITIKVKNMYRPEAPGTVISNTRDMNKDMLTSIVLKPNIIILNIKSKRVAAQSKFEARCKSTFQNEHIIVDYVASSGDRISAIVASSKQSSRELVHMELGTVLKKLTEFADVDIQHKSIICVVGNAQDSPRILAKTFKALESIGVKVQMMGQLSAKDDEQVMNISFVVKDNEAKRCVQTIHSVFFEDPAKFFHSINDEDIDPVRSAIDDVGYLDCVMDAGAPAAQPEQPFGVGIHSDDFGTEVPDFNMGVVFDVGEGCSGAPNILDENELSYHRVKETKDGALNTIEPMMLSDNLFLMPDTGQRFGESDPPATACQQFTGNPAAGNFAENPGVGGGSGFGCSPATAYACPAAYQTFAGARDGDDYPMLNEDAYTLHDNFNMEDFDVGSPPIRFDLITEATGV